MSDSGRELVHLVIEVSHEGEMSEVGWKVILHWLIEVLSKGEMSDTGWKEMPNRLIKTKSKMGDARRKSIQGGGSQTFGRIVNCFFFHFKGEGVADESV